MSSQTLPTMGVIPLLMLGEDPTLTVAYNGTPQEELHLAMIPGKVG